MWNKEKKKRALRTILTYGEPHKSWLRRGFLGTIGVVFFRLAMPWPLRGVIEVVFPRASRHGTLLVDSLPDFSEPVIWLSIIYILLAIGLGVFEYIQRVNIMRYAAGTVHDMRGAAIKGAASLPLSERVAAGDVISRIIGDSARIKAGISGILVHGFQNGLLFLAVCGVMLYIKLSLGLIFLIAGLIALFIGLRAATPVAKTTRKQRRKEGELAIALQEGLEYGSLSIDTDDLNTSSARKEVKTTKLIARSSLYVHIVLALAVGLALWVGSLGVLSGSIAPGELFLFIAYTLTVHRRMVQIGRQAARSGKVLACTDRLMHFLNVKDKTKRAENDIAPEDLWKESPLNIGLALKGVKLTTSRGKRAKPRLSQVDLLITPGTKVAVLGMIGSGKTSLLKVIAGAELPDKGKIFWDDLDMTRSPEALSSRVTFLPSEPTFQATNIWKILGLKSPDSLSKENEKTLDNLKASNIIKGCPKGLHQKISSMNLSRNEARILQLAGLLIGKSSELWVLDNPVQGFGTKRGALLLKEIFQQATGRTVVVAISEKTYLDLFDRVIFLKSGKVRFYGTVPDFKKWKNTDSKNRTEKEL